MRKTKKHFRKILLIIIQGVVLGVFLGASAALAGICNDGNDNDNDGKIDYDGKNGTIPDLVCGSLDGVDETVPGELKMIDKTRISHPAYEMEILWKTNLGSWNLKCDAGNINCSFRGDKILMYELNGQDTDHYPYAARGRYWVWGSVSALKALSKAYDNCVSSGGVEADCSRTWYEAYRANTHTLPAYQENKYMLRIMWSAIPGEEDIVYALRKDVVGSSPAYMVVKYNTVTDIETDVVSYNPGDTSLIQNAGIMGWTSDYPPLLVVANNIDRATDPVYKIWEIDVTSNPPQRTAMNSFPGYCQTKSCLGGTYAGNDCSINDYCPGSSCVDTDRWCRYPEFVAIHGGKSPDCNWGLVYSASPQSGVLYRDGHNLLGLGCNTSYNGGGTATFQEGDWNGGKITHPSWTVSNDWYFGGDEGDAFGTYTGSPRRISWWAYPWIDNYKHIYQVFWDANTQEITGHNLVVTDTGAGIHGIDVRPVCLGGANKGYSCSVENICPGPSCQCPDSTCQVISAQLNYNGLADPTPRADGRQLLWMSTGNHYSVEDHYCCDHPTWLTGTESIRRCRDVDYKRGLNCAVINANWSTNGYMIADLAFIGDNPADVNGDDQVNIKDIQICIKGIIDQNSIPSEQLQKCQAVALPDTIVNIKDIQAIVRVIINP